jgi:hypothetical protein
MSSNPTPSVICDGVSGVLQYARCAGEILNLSDCLPAIQSNDIDEGASNSVPLNYTRQSNPRLRSAGGLPQVTAEPSNRLSSPSDIAVTSAGL